MDGWFLIFFGGSYLSGARTPQKHMAHLTREVLQSLRIAGSAEPALGAVASALATVEAVDSFSRPVDANAGVFGWVDNVLSLLSALEPDAMDNWAVARRALLSISRTRTGVDTRWVPAEVLELAELADLVDICGQANRAAPHARDLVRRFFRKSVQQGRFFGDVRMTPHHFDDLVAVVAPHLPAPARGPNPIDPPLRIFSVLFWLAQGGRQRVVARAVDVAESTFSKHCAPVIAALIAGLPKPHWPSAAERRQIGHDFARLTGGNATGWSGLYVLCPCQGVGRRGSSGGGGSEGELHLHMCCAGAAIRC